jgi:FkbH-like protein
MVMNKEKPLSYYISKSNENLVTDKKIRIAILSSFTVNGLAETLKVKSAEKNIALIPYLAAYNQYNQEILNEKSELYRFSPDLTVLLIDNRSVLGNLVYQTFSVNKEERKEFVKNKVKEILNLASRFTKNSKSKLIIANLSIPTFSQYGIFDSKTEYGIKEMIYDFNTQLSDSCKNIDGVYVFDFDSFVSRYGEENIFNFQQFFVGDIKISLEFIPFLASDLMAYIIAFLGLSKKCIVLDLDNTLWGGIVGEDGFDGIQLGPQPPGNAYFEFQKILQAFNKRGIILAINSKNNPDDAIKIIREHPYMLLREGDFACVKINWDDKVTNMKEIAEELNIGLDSMVFFDDDPVNREYIKVNLPQVTVPELPSDPSEYPHVLLRMNDFSLLKITEEDTSRNKMYLEQKKRKELEESSSSLEDFLKTLGLRVQIKKSNNFTIPRISQLTLKTNQFNLTTKRYQEEDIRKFSQDDNMLVGCAQVHDKFGDNGITGVFIVQKENTKEWFLDTFLLSCRIMGRNVEKAILSYIFDEAKKGGVTKIKAKYLPTPKNKPIESFLPECGFQKRNDHWEYDLTKPFTLPAYLKIEVENV